MDGKGHFSTKSKQNKNKTEIRPNAYQNIQPRVEKSDDPDATIIIIKIQTRIKDIRRPLHPFIFHDILI